MWVTGIQFEVAFSFLYVSHSLFLPNPNSSIKTAKYTIAVCEVLLYFSDCVEIEKIFPVDVMWNGN